MVYAFRPPHAKEKKKKAARIFCDGTRPASAHREIGGSCARVDDDTLFRTISLGAVGGLVWQRVTLETST